MTPQMASAGAQGVASLISAVTGAMQTARARKMEKANIRPTMNIPGAVQDNNMLAKQMATLGMPGAQYAQGKQNIAQQGNAALGQAQDRRSGLAAIGAINNSANNANLALDVNNAQMRIANMRNLMNQNNLMGQWQQQQWRWNHANKYEENAAAIRALKGAGNANINSAMNGALSAGATMAANGMGGGSTGSLLGTGNSWNAPGGNGMFTGNNAVGGIFNNPNNRALNAWGF